PAEHVLRIMHQELAATLGEPGSLELGDKDLKRVVLVGLQGSGKTTTAAKLAAHLKERGRRPLLVAVDIHRPAAAEQLEKLASDISVPAYSDDLDSVEAIVEAGLNKARERGADVVIFDSAGRSQLDEMMMTELREICELADPGETLLVADAMTGQEALRIAEGFQEEVPLSGLVLTKMDGDARGGAAISMRSVTGVPIKFIGTGERMDAFENFEPDRLASRILGQGDLQGLLEKAEDSLDAAAAEQQVRRLQSGEFSLEDFASQLQQVQRLGPLGQVLGMLPGNVGGAMGEIDPSVLEKQLSRTQAIISSMTPRERRNPDVLNGSRKRRIAKGSGTSVQEVNQLLRQFKQMKQLFQQMGSGGLGGMLSGLR
ncbi:MAG: AAA family ATPase, partial [Anaerolineales bacterium]|nr:AAA family ATPase [Anaerolineales bacterium]